MGQDFKSLQRTRDSQLASLNKPQSTIKTPKSRFASMEFLITFGIMVVILAILIPLVIGFIDQAKRNVAISNAYNLQMALVAAVNIDSFSAYDLQEFHSRYSSFQPTALLFAGKNPLERAVCARLSTSYDQLNALEAGDGQVCQSRLADKIKGYIKIKFAKDGTIYVYLSEDPRNKEVIVYP